MAINNKSPIRYPGGKTRACKKLNTMLLDHFNMDTFDTIISPFFGGGSFEFYIQNNYNLNIIANDKFKPLYNFWTQAQNNKQKLCKELYKNIHVSKEQFYYYRNNIMTLTDDFTQALYFFIINRCSFSGATLSGGFSEQSSKGRFTPSSIDRINKLNLSKFAIHNLDCIPFIETHFNEKTLMFLDPPYDLKKKSKLYGNKGDMHKSFNHLSLFETIKNKKNWIMTYNNCDYIKKLYHNFIILETNWSYGMNKSKKSSEIVIISI